MNDCTKFGSVASTLSSFSDNKLEREQFFLWLFLEYLDVILRRHIGGTENSMTSDYTYVPTYFLL